MGLYRNFGARNCRLGARMVCEQRAGLTRLSRPSSRWRGLALLQRPLAHLTRRTFFRCRLSATAALIGNRLWLRQRDRYLRPWQEWPSGKGGHNREWPLKRRCAALVPSEDQIRVSARLDGMPTDGRRCVAPRHCRSPCWLRVT